MLVDAIENQSNFVDAILCSIDRELDWARTVMKSVEVHEQVIDWADVKAKVFKRGCGQCSICLHDVYSSDCVITSCEHCFHESCMASWLQFCHREKNTALCPVCRSAFQYRNLYY
jgi:hypothetical protein